MVLHCLAVVSSPPDSFRSSPMQCDERKMQDESAPESGSTYLTVAIVELASVRSPSTRRKFVWMGMDAVPYFPKLQEYLARLSLSVFSQIVWLQVDSGGLPHPIELRFPASVPTIH
jgi:hypothetical protein